VKEGRFAGHLRTAREIRAQPSRILSLLRGALLDVWRSRGGGLYGLGYIVAFIYFEADMLFGDISESAGIAEFALGQFFEYLIRFGFLSFIIAFKALLWPFYFLELYGGVGIILLVAGYLGFEHLLKPSVEKVFPELREHRQQQAEKKSARQAGKRAKQATRTKSGGSKTSTDPDR
jgi:hypothetical protein